VVASPKAKPTHRASLSGLLIKWASHHSASDRISEAESHSREAVEICKRLVADLPHEIKYRSDVVRAQSGLAFLLERIGKAAEADAAFRDALATGKRIAADFPSVAGYRSQLAGICGGYGIFCERSGRHKDAEAAFRDGLALNRQLAADFPSMLTYRQGLAGSWSNLGVTFAITGRPKEAEAAYRESIALTKRMISEVPDDTDYPVSLGRLNYNLALLLEGESRREALRESIAFLRPLASQPSRRHGVRFNLAKSLMSLVDARDHTRSSVEAEAVIREAIGLNAGLVAEAPKVSIYREEQAISEHAYGMLLMDVGRTAEAEAVLRKAIARFVTLVADVPGNPLFGFELGMAEAFMADVLTDRGEFAAALDWLARAAPRFDVALKANPDRGHYKGSSPNRVGRKSPVRASKPLDS